MRILVGLATVLLAPFAAHAVDGDAARRCAAVARYVTPDDPTGVDFEKLDAAIAIPACEAALKADPQDHAARANLARALSKAGRHAEKIAALRMAADAGNGQAMRLLALALEAGDGVAQDKFASFALLKRAAEAGYVPAMHTLARNYDEAVGTTEDDAEAVRWWRRAHEAGERAATTSLAYMIEAGQGVAEDQEEANRLYALAAAAGDETAMRNLGVNHRDGRGFAKDHAKALEWFRKALAAGSTDANGDIGYAFETGEGVARDPAEAVRWYRRGHEAGDFEATASLARMIEKGVGVAKDQAEANRLFALAAANGSLSAMRNLGENHKFAMGFPRDYVEALRWYRKAADAGDTDAYVLVGRAYERGEGVPRDDVEAVRWYRKGHEAGDGDATNMLGYMTERGRGGLTQDPTASARLYRQAAERGSALAMRNLATAYYFGFGVPLDKAEALAWHARAAETGNSYSMLLLGERYFKGDGAPVDLAEARRWLERAAAAGEDAAGEMLARATLADPALADGGARARTRIEAAATAGAGWAIAALAYPGAPMRALAGGIDSPRWLATLATLKEPATLIAAAEALKSGHLAEQKLDLALALSRRAETGDAFAALEHQIGLLLELKLSRAAMARYDKFVRSPTYLAAPPERRRALDDEFASRMTGHWYGDERSVELWQQLEARGFTGAAFALGRYYSSEGNPRRDPAEGVRWLKLAAERGAVDANLTLGYIYGTGSGVPEDAAAAVKYYRLAAAGGSGQARENLGYLYMTGDGVPRDDREAERWFALAASDGHLQSKYWLAILKYAGRGGPVDPAEAFKLLQGAVDCGFAPARVLMARAYFEGAGVRRNAAAGMRWLRLAAAQPDSVGQIGMAQAAVLGWGMKPDIVLARRYLIEARRRGDGRAAELLTACGETPSLDCLRKAEGFVPEPLMREPVAVVDATPDFVADEARLQGALSTAIAENQSDIDVSIAFAKLEELYMLYERPDALLRTTVFNGLHRENYLARVYGRPDNYFALFEASCTWSRASKAASAFGRPEAAALFAKVAVNRLQQARQRIADLDDDIKECFVEAHRDRYRQLAEIFLDMGRFEEAENVLAMLKDFEHASWTGGAEGRGQSLTLMPMTVAQRRALDAIERAGVALASASDARARKLDVSLREAAFESALDEVGQALTALEAGAGMTITDADAARPPRIQAVLKAMGKPGVAALQAVAGPNRIHWLLTTAAGQKVVPVTVELSTVAGHVRAYRAAIKAVDPEAATHARAIYDAVFAPVDAELRSVDARHVMLSLDDVLRYIPFSALHDGTDWLVARYAFSNFRDASDLASAAAQRPWDVAGFGASRAVAGFAALPKVKDELGGIVRTGGGTGVLPGTVSLDDQFDARSLGAALESDSAVIHIASHFALDSRGGQGSFLLLGNGDKLPLSAFGRTGALRFKHADFLALSACETGLAAPGAKGVEIDSMAEIAQDAGAPAVLASLWKVSDESTSRLMVAFYTRKSADGLGKSEALRQAQLDLIGEGKRRNAAYGGDPDDAPADLSHPFFWAPFVLLGDAA